MGPLTGIELIHRFAVDEDGAPNVRRAVPGKKTGESRDESGLAGARTPADPQNLTGCQAQRDVAQDLPAPAGKPNGEFLGLETGVFRAGHPLEVPDPPQRVKTGVARHGAWSGFRGRDEWVAGPGVLGR